MRLALSFRGHVLGDVEFDPPNEHGLRVGTLAASAAYHAARPRLQQPLRNLARMKGASGEEIRTRMLREHAELAAEGLMLVDAAGARVPTAFLQVMDMLPLDAAPEVLDMVGVHVCVRFAA
jgi:hypothetical protein